MTDDPISPAHYQGFSRGAEVIDITECLNFNRGNAVKYLARAGNKPGADEITELEKARWYIDREIERLEIADHQQRAALRDEMADWAEGNAVSGLSDTPPVAPALVGHTIDDLTVGAWYRLREGVDRMGIPTGTDWVQIVGFPAAHGRNKVEVAWPHITAGPLHTRAVIPAHHLTGDAHDGPPEGAA